MDDNCIKWIGDLTIHVNHADLLCTIGLAAILIVIAFCVGLTMGSK